MSWENIMEKKKGTPWPKVINKNRSLWKLMKQEAGKGTYAKLAQDFYGPDRVNKKETIKVWKEDAVKNATPSYRKTMKDR